MTGENGKPSLDRTARPDWARKEADGVDLDPTTSKDSGEAGAIGAEPAFSVEARMAHELVSLFLSITDQETRERCLAFVRDEAEGGAD